MDSYFPFSKKIDDKDSDRYSTASSAKSKNVRAYVGFEIDELKQTSLADIKQLKATISSYLKSSSQKYKNSEYLQLYKRINEELKSRNVLVKNTNFVSKVEAEVEDEKTVTFLGKKKHFQESLSPNFESQNVLIPSFLNDKEIMVKKAVINKLKEDSDKDSCGESDSNEYKNKKSLIEIINKKCIINGKQLKNY